jgi:hypothetical protein
VVQVIQDVGFCGLDCGSEKVELWSSGQIHFQEAGFRNNFRVARYSGTIGSDHSAIEKHAESESRSFQDSVRFSRDAAPVRGLTGSMGRCCWYRGDPASTAIRWNFRQSRFRFTLAFSVQGVPIRPVSFQRFSPHDGLANLGGIAANL